jgi:hypothetical protein
MHANTARPALPITAPSDSTTARLCPWPPDNPFADFFSRSCSATSVTAAGKISENGLRGRPPKRQASARGAVGS